MTEGLPEYPVDQIPVPLIEHEREMAARPSSRTMESGRVRRRRMQVELQEFLKVNWNFTEDQFEVFKTFYEETIDNGSLPFLMKTFEEDPAGSGETIEMWWELAFVGNYSHSRGDNLFSVAATLEVIDKLAIDPMPPIVFGYFNDEGHEDNDQDVENNPSACRENVSILMDNLEEGNLYVIEISPTGLDDSWDHFIFFALLTTEERATKHKRVSMSNWFLRNGVNMGQPWFRVKLYRDASATLVDEQLTLAGQPLPPEVDAPDMTLENVSEIDTSEDVATEATDTYGEGIEPLDTYRTSNGYVIPYSYLEDPMVFNSRMYRPFIRKYILRQHSWGYWGTLSTQGNQNQPVTITGPEGATLKWTRDGTVPTPTTPEPEDYSGVPNNAFAIENQFAGILMGRCFLGDCPSPLVMVCIDKLMYERPNFSTQGPATGVSGYCDLPQTDIVTGLPSESGNSCNVLYGGICNHEGIIVGLGWSGGGIATSRNSPFSNHGAMLIKRLKRVSESVYIGWPIHTTSAEHYTFGNSIWNSPALPNGSGYFNHWQVAARNHNWAIVARNMDPLDQESLGQTVFLDVIPVPFDASLAGELGGQGESDRAAWDVTRDLAFGDIMDALIEGMPQEACTQPFTFWAFVDRFDIIRSPLYLEEPRDLQWLGPGINLDNEIEELPFDPDPETEPTNPYDKFETYVEGNATTMTLSFRNGVHWDDDWVIRDGVNNTYGWDWFEDYADGAITDWNEEDAMDPAYTAYDGGENWWFDITVFNDDWVFRVGYFSQTFNDDWESYSAGPAPFAMTGGTGWNPDDTFGWRMDNDLIGGTEDWESYAAGAFVASNTGTNFLISENWITS